MEFRSTPIPGVAVVVPRRFEDERGFFAETFQAERFAEAGLPRQFVQFNVARSKQGVLRGLHYQYPHPQGKLVTCQTGRIYDVAVDLRRRSPTYGKWFALEMSDDNGLQLYVPEGCAHGYVALSETADVTYAVTALYEPKGQLGVAWDDPAIGIPWPVTTPVLAEKDRRWPRLAELDSPFSI